MPYSDQELLTATQIAYYDFTAYARKLCSDGISIGKVLREEQSVFRKLQNNVRTASEANNSLKYARAWNALELYCQMLYPSSRYYDWIVRKIFDDNEETGFYGCMIETHPHHAIVAFRGSESNNVNQIEKDWLDADLGLLNSTLTCQQEKASEFMSQIASEFSYQIYAVTGHSLGGNLAIHAALMAPYKMQCKISQAVNFDGPGMSGKYITHWRHELRDWGHLLTHYQWSFIGNLLFSIPYGRFETIRTKDAVYEKEDINSLTQKHDTGFVLLTKDGMTVTGQMDYFAKRMGRITKLLDLAPDFIGDYLVKLIRMIYGETILVKECGKKIGLSKKELLLAQLIGS